MPGTFSGRRILARICELVHSRLGNLADFLFGYDFFISYAHKDGMLYARHLRQRLEAHGYRTFLDEQGYTSGDDLRTGTVRRIRMSKKLILLARPYALSSSAWVRREVELFIALNRSPIVIDFDSALSRLPDHSPLASLLSDRISIREKVADGDEVPSEHVLSELVRSFDATRQETLRIRVLATAALVFFLVAVVAVWQWYSAELRRRVADGALRDARAASHFIEADRLMMEWDLEEKRASGLNTEIDRHPASGDIPSPGGLSSVRLSNLQRELDEIHASMDRLAIDARLARQHGRAELANAEVAWQRVVAFGGSVALRGQAPVVPKVFSVEVLSVGFGESLILHYGDPDAPRFVLIDGGQGPTFGRTLKPRLEALRRRWAPQDALTIEYLLISNQDNDRIGGFERMFQELATEQARGAPPSLRIKNVWYESFAPAFLGWQKSVVRHHIEQLAIPLNKPFNHLVVRPQSGRVTIDLGEGLRATVLHPDAVPLANLHRLWVREAQRRDEPLPVLSEESFETVSVVPAAPKNPAASGEGAGCADPSVVNRASLVILFEFGGRRFLHTGDSCSSQVEAGLRAAGLSDAEGGFAVDLLLVPHLGSHKNVDIGFFRRIRAQQYLFTSNGMFDTPNDATLQMILDARRDDAKRGNPYVFQFVNRDGTQGLGQRLDAFFASRPSQEYGYRRVFRSSAMDTISIDLMERMRY